VSAPYSLVGGSFVATSAGQWWGRALIVPSATEQDVGDLVCGGSVRIAPHLEQRVGTTLDADGSGNLQDKTR